MAYNEEYALYASQNPQESVQAPQQTQQPAQGDPLVQGGADPGIYGPAPAYSGLTGDPFQTALVTTAQFDALRPRSKRRPGAPTPPPQPFAGLSAYLGA
jgi:hypothetical protein